jgi:hypothetical protein
VATTTGFITVVLWVTVSKVSMWTSHPSFVPVEAKDAM